MMLRSAGGRICKRPFGEAAVLLTSLIVDAIVGFGVRMKARSGAEIRLAGLGLQCDLWYQRALGGWSRPGTTVVRSQVFKVIISGRITRRERRKT